MNSLKIYFIIISFSILTLNSCLSENPVQPTDIKPVLLSKIDSIVVNSNNVIVMFQKEMEFPKLV